MVDLLNDVLVLFVILVATGVVVLQYVKHVWHPSVEAINHQGWALHTGLLVDRVVPSDCSRAQVVRYLRRLLPIG